MGQVVIRNLEDEVLDAYRAAARRNDRSLEAELRDTLRRMRPLSPRSKKELQEAARRLRAMTPDVPQTPSEQLVREIRDGYRGA